MSSAQWRWAAWASVVPVGLAVLNALIKDQQSVVMVGVGAFFLAAIWIGVCVWNARSVGADERLSELEKEFGQFPQDTRIYQRNENGSLVWRVWCSDDLDRKNVVQRCNEAVRLVLKTRRLRKSLRKSLSSEVLQRTELGIWFAILEHFDLQDRSLERRYPTMPPSSDREIMKAAGGSAYACRKLRNPS